MQKRVFHLAQTVWPRFGGDQANRSRSSISGPHQTPTWHKIALSASHLVRSSHNRDDLSGVIVMPDETLRVCHTGMLSAVTLDGTILWQLDLRHLIPEDRYCRSSLPTALQTGETLLVLPDALLIVNRSGIPRRENRLAPDGTENAPETINDPDDSGLSPNLTYSGLPILSGITGEVYLLQKNLWHEIGIYGYDIVTPAVYPDNSLAIAGFARAGFCRVSLNGEKQWTTHVADADKLPTLNYESIAAIGSGNGGYSAFFSVDGKQIGEYRHAATFAEYVDGGWIAFSRQRLARLTTNGREIWGCEISPGATLSFVEQPIVDRDGFIYVRQQEGYLCYDAQGRKAFEVKLPSIPQGLMSIIAPGTMAYVMQDELFSGFG